MNKHVRSYEKAVATLERKLMKARRLGMDELTIQLLERRQENYRQMILDEYVVADVLRGERE